MTLSCVNNHIRLKTLVSGIYGLFDIVRLLAVPLIANGAKKASLAYSAIAGKSFIDFTLLHFLIVAKQGVTRKTFLQFLHRTRSVYEYFF
jgi:hypothetical protein